MMPAAVHFACGPDTVRQFERSHNGLQQQRLERALRRDKQRQKRIRDSGIDYEYKPLEAAVAPKAKHTRLDD